jgi:hypothetical protein
MGGDCGALECCRFFTTGRQGLENPGIAIVKLGELCYYFPVAQGHKFGRKSHLALKIMEANDAKMGILCSGEY